MSQCIVNTVNNGILSTESMRSGKFLVFNEIIETEERYVHVLFTLKSKFHEELLKLVDTKKKDFPTSDDINSIFSHIRPIFDVHYMVLLPELKKRFDEWDEKPYISDIFVKIFPFMKLYIGYLCSFSKMLDLYDQTCKKFQKFQKAVNDLAKKENNFEVKEAFLEPAFRIGRYKVLLESYKKKMTVDDAELDNIEDAIKSTTDVADKCENTLQSWKNHAKMWDISELFFEKREILSVKRVYIMDDELKMSLEPNVKSLKIYHTFLFEDSILFAKKGKKRKLEIAYEIAMPKIKSVSQYFDTSFNEDTTFTIECEDQTFYVVTTSLSKTVKWVQPLRKSMKKQNAISISRNPSAHSSASVDSFTPGEQDEDLETEMNVYLRTTINFQCDYVNDSGDDDDYENDSRPIASSMD